MEYTIGGRREPAYRPVRLLILAAVLGCCLWLAWNVPYTHDDWDWGQPVGLEWWHTCAMNNRYVGSFFVVVMTRSWLLKTVIMGTVMFALPLLAAAAAAPGKAGKNWFALSLLGCGLLIAMPAVSWRQTYGWVSAFSNFVVLGVWMLLLILLARRGIVEGRGGWGISVLMFLTALTGQLFAENVTALTAVAAVGLAVWSWKAGRGRPAALALLAGALIGLVLMFYNPLYSDLAAEGQALGGIRRLTFSPDEGIVNILIVLLRRYFGQILPSLLESYPAIWAALCAGALCRVRRKVPAPLLILAGLFCAMAIGHGCWVIEQLRIDFYWVHPNTLIRAALPFGVVILLTLALVAGMAWRAWLPRLALLGGALALMLPFAMLEEDGPRCAFPSAVLLLVLALSLLADLDWKRISTVGTGIFLATALVFHLQIFQVIGDCYALRMELLQEAVDRGEKSVILPTEAYRYYYTWGHNPQGPERAVSYRGFYGLPEDMELIFLPPGSYDVWPEVTQEMLESAAVF